MLSNHIDWMGWIAIASGATATLLLLSHLVRRPSLSDANTKLWLLMGIGVFPLASAGAANISGFKATQSRRFCGSCHVMDLHASDSGDPLSTSLAAIHARNDHFGAENCYACHEDYGMYGYVLTKMGGMRHVYLYLTKYHDMSVEQARREIRILKPLPNDNCTSCHTTTAPRWNRIADHASTLSDVRSGKISCASSGCHGYAHPMTKMGRELPDHEGAP